MATERRHSVLQPTALVNEACLKLFGSEQLRNGSRTEILALAALAMKNLLVDRARERQRLKRTPPGDRIELEEVVLAYEDRAVNLLSLNDALAKLAHFDEEMARAVELRFFGGLSKEETAHFLKIPLRTFERRWEVTKSWLMAEVA